MFIRRIGRKNGSTMVKIIENLRYGDQIKQKALSTVGVAKNLEQLKVLESVAKARIVETIARRTEKDGLVTDLSLQRDLTGRRLHRDSHEVLCADRAFIVDDRERKYDRRVDGDDRCDECRLGRVSIAERDPGPHRLSPTE